MDTLWPGDPRQVGAYRLIGRLGEGGMGQVYLGESPGGKKVAVKVVRDGLAEETEYRQRFEREVRAARDVGGFHTAVVVDADPAARPPWMATEYVPGPSLQDVIRDNGPLSLSAATALGAALAEGLAAIHDVGLVHRDLKPGNIIMAESGPKIIDFGIALPTAETALTRPNTLLGTYAFMSPEQFRTKRVTPASDMFALGCVLAYAATGRAPFDAPAWHQIMYLVLTEEPALGDIPASPLLSMVRACLAKEPERRPSPLDVLRELRSEPTIVAPRGSMPAAGGPNGTLALPDPAGPAWPTEAIVPGPFPAQLPPPQVPAEYVLPEPREPVTRARDRGGRDPRWPVARGDVAQDANVAPGGFSLQVAGDIYSGDAGTPGTDRPGPSRGGRGFDAPGRRNADDPVAD